MRTHRIFVLLAALVILAPASADIISEIDLEIYQIDNIAVNSDYYAATGQLQWSQGGIASLKHQTGSDKYRVTVNGLWTDVTDLTQPGGLAEASFASGSFDITFYDMTDPGKTNPIASLAGVLYPGYDYHEGETQENPSELYGSAPIRLTSWNVPGYTWAETVGPSGDMGGLTATTSNLFGTLGDIADYQSDWDSDNTIVTILADESGIPEPTTIALLGFGALVLLRRRRS